LLRKLKGKQTLLMRKETLLLEVWGSVEISEVKEGGSWLLWRPNGSAPVRGRGWMGSVQPREGTKSEGKRWPGLKV
jgi:hypothetical protein